jgi:type II secretory pathway pseudopilin PulG
MKRGKNRMQKQGGFSLWELAIIVGLVVMGITAGIVLLQSGSSTQRENDRDKLLQAADFAITAFIAENGRLPCPATDLNGIENCSTTAQKGWLPYATLGLDASAPSRGLLQIRYLAYKNGSNNLTSLTNRFSPSGWQKYETPSAGLSLYAGGTIDPLNALDFCQGLTNAIAAGKTTGSANITTGSDYYNVAYALVDGGIDRDGDSNIFDGAENFNATNPRFDSPTKSESYDYDDRVFARTFLEVANHLSCPQGTRAMDALAQAVEVTNEVTSQKADNADAAEIAYIVASAKAALAAVAVIGSVASMAGAVKAMSLSITGFTTNIPICFNPFTFAAGCPLMVNFGIAIGLSAVGIALAATAIGLNIAALVKQIEVAIKAEEINARAQGANATRSPLSLTDMVEQLRVSYVNAQTKAATDLQKSIDDRNAANTALTIYNNSRTNVYAAAHEGDPTGVDDAAITTVLNNYVNYHTALGITNNAQGLADSKRKQANGQETGVNNAKAAWDAAAAITPSTPENIIATTQAIFAQKQAEEAAAKAASDADPNNLDKIKAATDASLAAINPGIDASNAKLDAVNYVANKKQFYDEQKAAWETVKADATSAEATAASKKILSDTALVVYESSVNAASGNTRYNQVPYINYFGCLLGFNDPDHPENCYSKVKYRLFQAKEAYRDWKIKEDIAIETKKASDESAKAEIDAKKAYDNLRATVTSGIGSGTSINVSAGAAAILLSADQKGTVK